MYNPDDRDRRKLELLADTINDLEVDCGCGENAACDYCGLDVEFHLAHVSYDTLEITVRLKDIDPKSKIARLQRLDDEFAGIVRDMKGRDAEELEKTVRAARLMREKVGNEASVKPRDMEE